MHVIAKVAGVIALAAALAALAPLHPTAVPQAAAEAPPIKRVDFRGETVSAEVRHIAEWAVRSGDHEGYPFIIVDKITAKAAAFDPDGRLIQVTPVLIGIALGDRFAPGVAQMDMYQTKPSQRVTPAGRFFAEEYLNLQGDKVLWVDYDSGIAIHKLPKKRTKERRQERIVSADPAQHRITYGCINVPPSFYDRVVRPYFGAKGGVVYVLPDSTPLAQVFKSHDLDEPRLSKVEQTSTRAMPTPLQRF
jgi:hypothetical protein